MALGTPRARSRGLARGNSSAIRLSLFRLSGGGGGRQAGLVRPAARNATWANVGGPVANGIAS